MSAETIGSLSAPEAATTKQRSGLLRSSAGAIPALLFVSIFLLVPAGVLFSYSVLTQSKNGNIGLPLTLDQYDHLANTALYIHVFIVTLQISLWTSALSVLLGYPIAIVMTRGTVWISRVATIILVSPLVVSIVVRTYGWELVLANNNTGLVNWALSSLGMGPAPLHVMYTETAVVIGSLHVFLPMLVLPLASSLARIEPSLEQAARTLGASAWRAFWRVTVPLTVPGLVAGLTIVFSLTFSSYITPALLGGNRAQMLGNLLEQQVIAVNDWPAASSIATLMVVITFAVTTASAFALERQMRVRRLQLELK